MTNEGNASAWLVARLLVLSPICPPLRLQRHIKLFIVTDVYFVLEVVKEVEVITDLELVASLPCERQEVTPVLLVELEDLFPVHILLKWVYRHLFDNSFAVEDTLIDDFTFAVKLNAESEFASFLEVADVSAPLVASYGPPEAVSPALLDLSLVDVPYLALGRLVE